MLRSGLKVVVAVLASVAVAGVVTPAANASERSVQVQVCNDNSEGRPFRFKLFGRNQNGQESTSGYSVVQGHGCTLQGGWWWSVGSTVQITFNFADKPIPRGDLDFCGLESSLRDGSTKTCRIS